MFTAAYSAFHQQYPNITIVPRKGIVRDLQRLISQGDLDIGFLTLTDMDRTNDVYETIYREELFLAIPSIHPAAQILSSSGESYATMDIRTVQHEPFVVMDKRSTMRTMMVDQILFETGNNNTVLPMLQANLCCGILAYYYVKNIPQEITCFHLPNRPTWQFAACYKKGRYLSSAARGFIDLMKSQWSNAGNEIKAPILSI